MFQRIFGREKKTPKTDKTEESNISSGSLSGRRIVWAEVPEAKTPHTNHTGTPWLQKLFGRPLNKEKQIKGQVCCLNDPATTTTAGEQKQTKKKKRSGWRRIFDCCRKKNRVAPCPPEDDKEKVSTVDKKAAETEEVQKVQKVQEDNKDEKDLKDETERKDERPVPTTSEDQAAPETSAKQELPTNSDKKRTKRRRVRFETSGQLQGQLPGQPLGLLCGGQQAWLGFPNPSQICYMNSSLQSLITLVDFIVDISCQEEVWASVPGAKVIGTLMNVVRSHRSLDRRRKLNALFSFKRAVSVQAPEFEDHQQKDAHEFLTTVLHQIRSLSPLMQEVASTQGRIYRCPVEEHLVFTMQNTRTCKSCGVQSTQEEDFTNLSLTLIPGGSVQDMLQDYLMETELDFRCDCGAYTSGQQSTFKTLPKVLMLHLKRFCFNGFWQLQKLSSPVHLFRELLVTSSQGDRWFSLVSVISHLGTEGNYGHYISDGVHPDVEMDDPADRWLNYNDTDVTETTGDAVCQHRQQTAYVLFYKRQVEEIEVEVPVQL